MKVLNDELLLKLASIQTTPGVIQSGWHSEKTEPVSSLLYVTNRERSKKLKFLKFNQVN